jgi:hypothetical protein
MTDDSQAPAPDTANPKGAPKPRRTSKNAAKQKSVTKTADFPDFSESLEREPESSAQTEPRPQDQASDPAPQHSESEIHEISSPETVGGESQNAKRKRRRKRGKGNSQQQEPDAAELAESTQPQRPQQSPQAPSRPKLDPEMVAKRAWKIYLSEVSEEGVALVSDQDAKDLTRRCFRLAEIFLEEQARRL